LPVFETHYSNHVAIWRLAGAADPLAVSDKVSQLRLPLCDSAIDCVQFFDEWAVFRQDYVNKNNRPFDKFILLLTRFGLLQQG
jgi:hypothetical protein